jgi:hypothetical protein
VLSDRDDDGPNQLADHFLAVLVKFRQHSWTHYLSENLTKLHSFKADWLQSFRGFDSEPQPIWLGYNLLQRSVKTHFNFLIQLYFDYNINRCVPFIQARLGNDFAATPSALADMLLIRYPSLAPKKRGRKRKRLPPSVDSDQPRDYEIDDIIWEGITQNRVVAVFCRWTGYAESANSWQPLNDQPLDFIEWWKEELEMRYPLCRPREYQVPLARSRNGAFSR